MKGLKLTVALLLLGVAGLLAITEFFAWVDPVGTKMADDADPLGAPHIVTWLELAIVMLVVASLSLFAFRLLRQALGKQGE